MFRTDNSTSAPALATVPPVGSPGYFTDGNPASGLAATIVDDWWMNMMQEEIMTVIIESGLTPNKTDNTQLWQALQRLYPRVAVRQDFTVYVDPVNGNDSRDGLSQATAWRTIQYATNYMLNQTDLNGHTVTVKLMPGTHDGVVHAGNPAGCLGADHFIYEGNVANPATVIIAGRIPPGNGCMVFIGGAQATVRGVKFQMLSGADGGCAGIYTVQGSTVFPAYCEFGQFGSGIHMICDAQGSIGLWGPYSITGHAAAHWLATGGTFTTPGRPSGGFPGAPYYISIQGSPTFSSAFAVALNAGRILLSTALIGFDQSANGMKFQVGTHAEISTTGRGVSWLPGLIAGAADASTYGLYL